VAEGRPNGGGWVIPWQVYVDRRFEDNAKLYDERTKASETALRAATAAMDRRLDAMNEFRDQLRDQASTFVSRIELKALDDKIDLIQRSQDQAEGRRTVTAAAISAGVSLVTGVVVGLIVFALAHH
jgi:hypothetical protein